ncbi:MULTISPECIES: hypothetical protein [Methylobacter]
MKRTIFYSWQSDLDASGNRNLIEDALKRSIKSIKKDDTESVEPVLDRDTAGISGSPSISESIFAKITLADVFVADVSLINPESGKRLTPNPNVLVELGYAIAQLGWERVVLVQNTAYGSPEDLPFDLRGRRVVPYSFRNGTSDRSEVRALLQGRLEAALKAALHESTQMSLPTGKGAPLWWGRWKNDSDGLGFGGALNIREVCATGFLFDLSVFNGSHSGEITSYARLVAQDLAYARVENGPEGEVGEIQFRRELSGDRQTIRVEETSSCLYYHGMGVQFFGNFVHVLEPLFDYGFLNELEMMSLARLTGEYYESLRVRFQGIGESECLDSFEAKVIHGGVRGLYTIMEGIIMSGSRGELWAAYLDDDVVKYFTTESKWKEQLPKTIENWRSRFSEKPVTFHAYTSAIITG